MKNIKSLIFSLVALIALAGVGWGTYALTGPSSKAEADSDHAGHDHGQAAPKKDVHDHTEDKKVAKTEEHRDHDDHEEHGHHDDDEDLEGLFTDEKSTSAEEHHDDPGHDSHPEAQASRSGKKSGYAGDEHAGHDHGHAEGEICPEHNVPEVEDALCNSEGLAMLRPGEGMKVRLASSQVAERVGIATTLPLPAGEAGSTWSGQVVFNRDRLARLSALSAGTVLKVRAGLGDRVQKGAVLAEIAAPEAASLRGELTAAESRRVLAETVYQREKDLFEKGISSRQGYQQAEAELRQAESLVVRARQQAQDFGLGGSGSTLTVRAPFAGVVVERTAAQGEAVASGTPLFTLTDLSTLWVEVSAPEDALLEMRPGQAVTASFAGLPGRAFAGKIFWVAPALDERTRMLKALAEIDNREGLLKSGLFGQIHPAGRAAAGALSVPADALQSVDGQPFVFVRLEEDLFELRRVTAGRKANGTVTIPAGLNRRDQVVSAQAFALKSEVLRARLGASCADH
jgi:membrane fusion protein, heavy metal efflux system